MRHQLAWRCAAVLGVFLLTAGWGRADTTFSGTLYYTNYNGGANVNSVQYSYDATTSTFTLSNQKNIVFSNGADGIIFDGHGNILVGGQSSDNVYQYSTSGTLLHTGSLSTNSYHLALDPSGNDVYTSTFQGPLEVLPLTLDVLGNATQYTVKGYNTGVTQLAFLNGVAYYDDGSPNCCGAFGTIDLSTEGLGYVTTALLGSGTAVHGMVVDPFTNLLTFFGSGFTGTYNPGTSTYKQSSGQFACDFDQGALDGQGHALIAGCNSITFLDYSKTGDITNPNFHVTVGGFSGIDDVAPLSGLGSSVPEPSSIMLLGFGLLGIAFLARCMGARAEA